MYDPYHGTGFPDSTILLNNTVSFVNRHWVVCKSIIDRVLTRAHTFLCNFHGISCQERDHFHLKSIRDSDREVIRFLTISLRNQRCSFLRFNQENSISLNFPSENIRKLDNFRKFHESDGGAILNRKILLTL